LGSIYQKDPVTGKLTQVKAEEPLKDVIDPKTGLPTNVRASAAEGKQPFNQSVYGAASISDQTKDLAYQFAKNNGGKLPPDMNFRSDSAKAAMADYIAKRAAAEGETSVSMVARGQAQQAAQSVVKSFTSGKDKDTINAINTAVAHIDSLQPLVDALGTGDIKKINSVTNWFKNQVGRPAPTDYASLKEFVGGEVAKSVLPGGGGEKEREALMGPLDAANSPEAIKSALGKLQIALAGKTEAQRNTWDVGTNGTQGNFDKFLLPATKKALGITSDTPAPAANIPIMTPEQARAAPKGTKFQTTDGRVLVRQ
jgi:hypothetical protein